MESTYQYKKLQSFLETSPCRDTGLMGSIRSFLTEREDELSHASITHLYRSLVQHAEAVDLPINEITPAVVIAYVDGLQTRYSPGTIRPIVGDLKQFYKWAYVSGLTNSDYGHRLKKPKPVKQKHHAEEKDMLTLVRCLAECLSGFLFRDSKGILRIEPGEWSYEEYKILHDLTAVLFLYETGCRAGELCNLSSHRMNKAVQTPAAAYSITCYGKTNGRTYLFTETTAELYRLWAKQRRGIWAFCNWKRGHKPQKLLANGLSQMLVRRCNQFGITVFRAHSMRHAKVIRSRKLVGLDIASRLIDHSSIETTRGYDYTDESELEAAAILTGLRVKLW